MTLSVAGRMIQQVGSVSQLGRLALAFVDGGLEWLSWAIAEPVARYEFPDETLLVAQVQQGLHTSPLAMLPQLGILVSPVKLMTLGLTDLRSLARAEGGEDSPVIAAQVHRVLDDHRLVTHDDLAAVPAFLAQLDLASAPLFQAIGFEDCLAIHGLITRLPCANSDVSELDTDLQKEAAAFGLQQARSPIEFCDYFEVFLHLSERAGLSASTAQARAEAASRATQTLLPRLFCTLDCPQLSGLPSPEEVGLAVRDWLARGHSLGFARLSQALRQIICYSSYDGHIGADAEAIVRTYLNAAQAFISTHRPTRGRLGQDGATCTFPLDGTTAQAELHLNPRGVISLGEFSAIPASPPNGMSLSTTPHPELVTS